ncbi:MAG: hypothetical protein HUU35_08340, partial [Armatimonadetes bacterium]|nr:hypothetical protein [Armatimonadota bacterium]
MKCKAVRRWLRENTVASLDEAPAAVREHGTACPECRATWQRQHDALDL